jgi:hypothetical protein
MRSKISKKTHEYQRDPDSSVVQQWREIELVEIVGAVDTGITTLE